MSRSRSLLVLRVISILGVSLLRPQASTAQAASPQVPDVQTACAADIRRLCSGVTPGGGRIIACLKQNQDQVSDSCKRAIFSAMGRSSGNAGSAANPTPAPPAATSAPVEQRYNAGSASAGASSSPVKSSLTSKQNSHSASTASTASGKDYFLMKQVKIIDQGMGQGKSAYHLMVPNDWQFKGWVNAGVAEGGCYDDWFSVFGDAISPDNSVELQILPQETWQYIDDPAGQRQMQAQNQLDVRYGMKACPIRAPVRAETYLRQDMVKRLKGCTVISVEPFPELAETVRHQLGLPPGGNTGNTRVDAARMRVDFSDDKGQPSEAWVTAAIVVHIMQGGGSSAAYDWHAGDVLFFRTTKGKLDANEKLFKLIAGTIHPEAEWQRMSNGYIASLYQMKAKQVSIQQQIVATFRQHAADVINGITANQIAGANQSHFGQDQLIRGVQTFRDPATGGTLELSNQFDHAWLNGANEYVMSDDPNFNPNGNLNGNWNQLQLVHPQP
jgi:hypothetical protein